ncbi:K+ channel tetramerization domain protein [Ostertagia ostertagi]
MSYCTYCIECRWNEVLNVRSDTQKSPSKRGLLFHNTGLLVITFQKGEVFIDRDPTLFKYILNYLRDGRMMFPDDALTTALLFQEAKFYGLGHLVEQISLLSKNSTGYHDIKAPRK